MREGRGQRLVLHLSSSPSFLTQVRTQGEQGAVPPMTACHDLWIPAFAGKERGGVSACPPMLRGPLRGHLSMREGVGYKILMYL